MIVSSPLILRVPHKHRSFAPAVFIVAASEDAKRLDEQFARLCEERKLWPIASAKNP